MEPVQKRSVLSNRDSGHPWPSPPPTSASAGLMQDPLGRLWTWKPGTVNGRMDRPGWSHHVVVVNLSRTSEHVIPHRRALDHRASSSPLVGNSDQRHVSLDGAFQETAATADPPR